MRPHPSMRVSRKNINGTPSPNHPDDDLSRNLIQLQTHTPDLMKNIFDLVKDEGKINALMQVVKKHMTSDPKTPPSLDKTTSLQNQTPRPDLSLQDTIHSLTITLTAFMKQYRQMGHYVTETYSDLFLPELDDDNQDRSPISTPIPKISLSLIYVDMYTLTRLIYHHSQFEYFRIFSYFPISSALEKINPETDGLILISSGLIQKEPIRIIRTIKHRITSKPIIVMEDTTPKSSNIPVNNGIVIEENSLSEIRDQFLAGLCTQTLKQVKDFIKYYRGYMKSRSIFTRRWCSRGYV
jgi:hypothetical protein